ncbi:hypothetical protein ACOMHN_005663 [Nucella lapillus]
MVGVKTLKQWFFDQHVLHPHRAPYHFQQLDLPPDIPFPLQNELTVISKDFVPSVHLPKASVMERPPQEHNEQQHVLNSVANQDQRNSNPQVQSNASDKSKDSPTAVGKKSEIEKKIAERIVSRNQKTRGKHPLRSEDHYIENRGPDGATRKVDVRRLHRSFSLAALKSGNVYTTEDNQPGARVIHVAVFVEHGAFTALMTLVNSVVKNTHFRNVTFHFVTSSETDRMRLKYYLEFAPFRLPEILPYMGGRVIILDPYCLVKGDISELAEMHISRGHYAAMATLCNADPVSNMPENPGVSKDCGGRDEQSPASDTDHFLYHWVGKGKPWESSSPVSAIWNAFLVRSTDDSG